MSTPLARSPRSPAGTAPAPTRQQLDELDALLQRMLDLPVNPIEDVPAEDDLPPEPPRPRTPARPEVGFAPAEPPRLEAKPAEPPAPPPPRRSRQEPAVSATGRVYPASYMVVETRTPSNLSPQGQPAADAGLGPRILPGTATPVTEAPFEAPVPGGRHDLVADEPDDPVEEGIGPADAENVLGSAEDWVPFQSSWQPSEQTWKPLAQNWEQGRVAPTPSPLPPAPTPRHSPSAPEAPAQRAKAAAPAPVPRDLATEAAPRSISSSGPVVVTQTATSATPDLPQSFVRPAERQSPDAGLDALSRPKRTPAPDPPRDPERYPLVLLPVVWFNAAFDGVLSLGGPLGAGFKSRGGRNVLGAVGVLCLLGAIALAVADGIGWTW